MRWDLDENIRNEIELDLEHFRKEYGIMNAILVGGDVAFSGASAEYELAGHWLTKICNLVGCEAENVATIPGNHDVDRSKIGEMLRNSHAHFRQHPRRSDVDPGLNAIINTPGDAETFFRPFENYYKFAAKYRSIPNDTKLYWEKDFEMSPIVLRVRGVNSALISDKQDDENSNKLILGSVQTDIKRKPNVVHVFMCHHPPEWLHDRVDAQRDLNAKCSIQLFGHVHREDSKQIDNCVIIEAGAMHPERDNSEWRPCYNIVDLDIINKSEGWFLEVKVWKRIYDSSKTLKFIPKFNSVGSPFEKYSLKLPEIQIFETPSVARNGVEATGELTMPPETKLVELIDVNKKNPIRQLAYMFLSLPYHKRIRIAVELELTRDEDEEMPDTTRSQLYFKRAQQGNKLKQLWDHTTASMPETEREPNPF